MHTHHVIKSAHAGLSVMAQYPVNICDFFESRPVPRRDGTDIFTSLCHQRHSRAYRQAGVHCTTTDMSSSAHTKSASCDKPGALGGALDDGLVMMLTNSRGRARAMMAGSAPPPSLAAELQHAQRISRLGTLLKAAMQRHEAAAIREPAVLRNPEAYVEQIEAALEATLDNACGRCDEVSESEYM